MKFYRQNTFKIMEETLSIRVRPSEIKYKILTEK